MEELSGRLQACEAIMADARTQIAVDDSQKSVIASIMSLAPFEAVHVDKGGRTNT